MIITDLDDTLLRNDKSISEYTISILNECQAKGIKIVFATARSIQATTQFFEIFNPDIFIGYGGSIAVAGDEIISRFDIPADISSQLIHDCLQIPEISTIHATNEYVAYTNRLDLSDKSTSHYQCVDFSLHKDISYLKISLTSDNPNTIELIAAKYPTLDLLRYTGENLYRFANRNAVKWNAVKAVADYYNIDTDLCIAFGDDVNDVDMVRSCGIGVAVDNAIEAVKSVANHICDTNESDGVAKWLANYLTISPK